MQLLSKQSATAKLKQDNDVLIESNIRLRGFESITRKKLNSLKEDYEPEKIEKLKEFEMFCKDILLKKSNLLEELNGIGRLIKAKKEEYFSLIEKMDLLDEKKFQAEEVIKKANLREAFVVDLEKKWQQKNELHS